mgnify:FL=1|jgi:hypothetical protein
MTINKLDENSGAKMTAKLAKRTGGGTQKLEPLYMRKLVAEHDYTLTHIAEIACVSPKVISDAMRDNTVTAAFELVCRYHYESLEEVGPQHMICSVTVPNDDIDLFNEVTARMGWDYELFT